MEFDTSICIMNNHYSIAPILNYWVDGIVSSETIDKTHP